MLLRVQQFLFGHAVQLQGLSADPATARDYLTENFNVPQVSIAQRAGISQRWLCTRFQEIYQITPAKYLTSLRITAALEILKTKNYTISEIAAAVGYSKENY